METKHYRGGAPKKEAAERKERIVRVLFNQAEFTKLSERKALTKCANLSDFIRQVCLDKPLHMKPQFSTHEEKLLSLVREMRSDILRIGVNVNQSSKRINATTEYQDLKREVNQMADQLGQVDGQMRTLMSLVLDAPQHAELKPVFFNGSPNQ